MAEDNRSVAVLNHGTESALSRRERGPTEFASVTESHLIVAEDNRSVAVLNHGTESAPSPWGEGWGEGDTD
ncbi:hypothetical protein DFO62_102109 [Serratia fonticola]|nr:hypothetical protein DFO62_102109 [Serratia fonticola]